MFDRIRNEPAVLIGLGASLAVVLQAELADGSVEWEALVPLVAGIVTRFFVSPAKPAGG